MSFEIMRLENELLNKDLIFDEKNFSFIFHNHEDIHIKTIKLYRDFEYVINIEIEGEDIGFEVKYLESLFGKKNNFILKNNSTLESYNISCIINRQSNSITSDGHFFNFSGYVSDVKYIQDFIDDINVIQEWYIYNGSNKLKLLQSTNYFMDDKFLLKKRNNNYYNGECVKNYFDFKIDLSSLNNIKIYHDELKKQSGSSSMNNLLLSFNQHKFYVEFITNVAKEKFLIIEYNKKFGIPSINIREQISNLFSFLYGSKLIKISEKQYNTNFQLFNEICLSPYVHDLDLTLQKQVKPIEFVLDRDNFIKLFYEMSKIYSNEKYNFLDCVFREYFYISSLELKSEIILLEGLFDMIVKGYCYNILNINQVFDDENFYLNNKNKCIKKFTTAVDINEKNINKNIKRIRNSVTHGDYKIKNEELHKAKFYYRTLINESILKILGYNGEFMNYYQLYKLEQYKERLFKCLSAKEYDEKEYTQLQEIKYELMPNLYRYMPAKEENIKQYLLDNKIKLSTANYYEDTKDTAFYVNKKDIQKYLEDIKTSFNEDDKFIVYSENNEELLIPTDNIQISSPILEKHKDKEEIYEKISTIGQKSFTSTKNSQFHWMEYAGDNGFCVEYNFKKLDFNTHIIHNIFPVCYMEKPHFDIKNYSDNWLNLYYIALIKDQGYINDNEWRLIQIIDDSYEYKDEIKLPKPECVYLSKNIANDIKEEIIKICEERNIKIELK